MRHLVLNSLVLPVLLATPAVAHQVQVSEAVGATLHIEPNDVARAGEPTQLWFALVHRGGQPIPLSACQCQLTLYDQGGEALLTPSLRPLSVEDYEAIATITFPAVGSYELVLEGQAQAPGAFPPFELTFSVTVATAATPAQPSSTPAVAPATRPESSPPPPDSRIILGTALLLGLLGGVGWTWARSRQGGKDKDL